MALRYTATHYDIGSEQYKVEIFDSAFSGTAGALDLASGGYSLKYTGENSERHNTYLGLECTFTVRIADVTDEQFAVDLANSHEGQFQVRVTNLTDGYVTFLGNILADIGTISDAYYPYSIQITATDGLAALKDVPYDNDGVLYTGIETYITHIGRILSKLTYVSGFYSAGSELFRTAIDWHEDSHADPVTASDDPWQKTWVDSSVFWGTTGEPKAMDCLAALKHLLAPFGARIMQMEGVFYIEQISYRTASSYFVRKYDTTGAQIAAVTQSGVNNVDQITDFKLQGVQYEFFPPLRQVEVLYKPLNRRNYLWGYSLSNSNTALDFPSELSSNGGDAVLRLTGDFHLKMSHTYTGGGATPQIIVVFGIYLRVGNKSVVRDGYVQNFSFIAQPASWQADNPGNKIKYPFNVSLPPTGINGYYSFPVDFTTPQLSSDGDYEIVFDFFAFYTQSGSTIDPSNFSYTWTLDNLWLEVYKDGDPALNEDEVLYQANNPTSGNTAVVHIDTIIGDPVITTGDSAIGRLRTGTSAAALSDATKWGAGTDSRTLRIADLMAKVVLHGQLTPTYKMMGQVYGDLRLWRKYVTESTRQWLMLGGTYQSQNRVFDGEWFELDYGSGGVSVTPVRKKKVSGDTPPIIKNPNSNSAKFPPGYAVNPAGAVLGPVANALVDGNIDSGAITSIDLLNAVGENEYQAGELITLFDPVNAAYEDLVVTSSTAYGATSISVTGTLVNSYPDGAYILKKPTVGITSLPGGNENDTLRRNATAWEANDNLTNDGTGIGMGTQPLSGRRLYVSGSMRLTGSAGTATVLVGRDANGDISGVSVGSGLLLSGGVLSSTAGGGSVTSVGLAMPSGFGVSGSPVTGSGTLTVTTTLNGPLRGNGSGFTTGNINLASEVTGVTPIANGGTALSALGSGLQLIRVNAGATALEYFTPSYLTGNQTITLSGDVTGSGTTGIGTTISAGAVTLAKMENRATQTFIGRNTAGTGAPEELSVATAKTMLGISGTNTGDQTITLTGDVTGSGTGSFAATISANAVTDAKFRQSAGLSVVGRSASTTGNVADITAANDAEVLRRSGTSIGFGQVATGGIANSAVTYAKIQNISATQRLLGRNSAGAGVTEELTIAQALDWLGATQGSILYRGASAWTVLGPGTAGQLLQTNGGAANPSWATVSGSVTGTGSAGHVAYWTSASNLSFDSAQLFWDDTNNRLGIGTSSPVSALHVGLATGTSSEGLRVLGNLSANLNNTISNSNNASAGANAILSIISGGSSAGDPIIQLGISGAVTWSIGLDNSDSDAFVIAAGSAPGSGNKMRIASTGQVSINSGSSTAALNLGGLGNTSGTWAMLVNNSVGSSIFALRDDRRVGILNPAPTQELDVSGDVIARQYMNTSAPPTVLFGTGAGTGATTLTVDGGVNFIRFQFNTGTSPVANGDVFTLVLNQSFPVQAHAVFSPGNAQTATDISKFYISSALANNFVVKANGTLPGGAGYMFYIHIGGY